MRVTKRKLSADVLASIQKAVYHELFASHLYRQLAACMQAKGFFGAQKWFDKESSDELEHYEIWREYLNARGYFAEIPSLPAIKDRPETLAEALSIAFNTETKLADFYDELCESSEDAGDCTTETKTLQFVKIQTESVGDYGDFLARLELAGDDRCAVLIIDKELGDKA